MRIDSRQLIQLYFDADRTSIRNRYHKSFEPIGEDHPEHQQRQQSFTEAEKSFSAFMDGEDEVPDEECERIFKAYLGAICDIALGELAGEMVKAAFARVPSESLAEATYKFVQYVFWDIKTAHWTETYLQETLAFYLGIETASHLCHCVAPTFNFPLNLYSTDIGYKRLLESFRRLGVEFEDHRELLPIEVWRDISAVLEDFRETMALEYWQLWAIAYDLGPRLLDAPGDYPDQPPRVWVVATNNHLQEFEIIDNHEGENVGAWAVNPQAKRGDIALMYCVSPRSAIVSVYRLDSDAYYDPFGEWNNYRAELTDRIPIPWIQFSQMKDDPVLGNWKLVRCNFQGLLKHEVPEDVWNRLVDLVTETEAEAGERLRQYVGAAQGVRSIRISGEKWTEEEFEKKVVLPLLIELGWESGCTLMGQVEMDIKVGSGRPRRVRADFVGYRERYSTEAMMVVETKRRIGSTSELKLAVEQAESYAGKLRCSCFAVAAPEGLWVYTLRFPGQSHQIVSVDLDTELSKVEIDKLRPYMSFDSLKEGQALKL